MSKPKVAIKDMVVALGLLKRILDEAAWPCQFCCLASKCRHVSGKREYTCPVLPAILKRLRGTK